ncbi:O-methyltransferase [Dictyobacter sp. S3.2.2.5]|uniref:O-methyltransferase n=1 Tax=Dictyobacter halimunensis TaxID=3026934 RepID=A0ABQ6FLT1_9CHLR|nr:O-methyltransferase [Dictyobacter sp. S3.2.2.5]
MDQQLQALLTELYEEGQRNDAQAQERRKKRLNLEPETAQLLSVLVRSGKRTRLLEIGTSNGYSTIWLAWAARLNGGTVISIDREAEKHQLADANLRRASLRDVVQLVQGDATSIVADLAGPFDFVFFDADRFSAPAQLNLLLPRLTPDVLVLADNVHSHPDEIADYLATVQNLPDFEHMVLPVGKGLSLAYRHQPSQSVCRS